MLAISRALLTNPKLLLLDEPTQGLAPNIVNELFKALSSLLKSGLSIIIVEQNIKMALNLANKVSVIGKGKLNGQVQKVSFKIIQVSERVVRYLLLHYVHIFIVNT